MTANPPSRLDQLRRASLAFLDDWPEAALRRQAHAELSPLLWHVGHVFFVETYWLAERVFGDRRTTDRWRALYFPEACQKTRRGTRLPDRHEMRLWAAAVSADNDSYWQRAQDHRHPLLEHDYLAVFLRQHYAQHLETMRLAAAHLNAARAPARASAIGPSMLRVARIRVSDGCVQRGTAGIEAYDNEQPPGTRHCPAFAIARRPVDNAEWLGFMAAGGYHEPSCWDDDGWAWRTAERVEHPEHWQALGNGQWHIPDTHAGEIGEQPVHGISWYEARAFARYAGARLPHETEWEAARRAGILSVRHQVWEWCNNAFHPYPGFRAFPYDGYSKPWFDGRHFVARGASALSEPEIRRPGFRNFYPPTHRHIFAGLRLAW